MIYASRKIANIRVSKFCNGLLFGSRIWIEEGLEDENSSFSTIEQLHCKVLDQLSPKNRDSSVANALLLTFEKKYRLSIFFDLFE